MKYFSLLTSFLISFVCFSQDTINIKALGVKGDGTDERVTIQAAFNAQKNKINKPVIFFPGGTYLVANTLQGYDGMNLVGVPGESIIKGVMNGNQNLTILAIRPQSGQTWRNITITGIHFQGINSPERDCPQSGIGFGTNGVSCVVRNVNIINCEFSYFRGKAIDGTSGMFLDTARIDYNYIHHVGTPEMIIPTPGSSGIDLPLCSNVSITGNIARFIGEQTSNEGDWFCYFQQPIANTIITGNLIENCNGGICMGRGRNVLIENNNMSGLTCHGVFMNMIQVNMLLPFIIGGIEVKKNSITLAENAGASGITIRNSNLVFADSNNINCGGSMSNGIVILNGETKNIALTNNRVANGKFRAFYITSTQGLIDTVLLQNNLVTDTSFNIGLFVNGTNLIRNITGSGNTFIGNINVKIDDPACCVLNN